MRVLFASSLRGLGGGEGWYLQAARGLAARGHAVHVAPRRGSALERAARRAGLAVEPIDYGGVLDPRPVLALRALLGAHGIEVVVANLEKELWHAALAARALHDVALVNRRGSPIPIRADARRRWLYGRVDRILVSASHLARSLVEGSSFLRGERLTILANGLDPLAEARSGRAGDWPRGPGARLLAVGELTSRKNPLGLLRALARVRAPWRFLWIGQGPLAADFERCATELGLAGRVRRLGWVPGARRWTREADLLIHFSDSEGQSWAVLEALVEGTPVVCTRASGWEGLAGDDNASLGLEAGDEEGLARAVEAALAAPEAARQVAERLARRVREENGAGVLSRHLEAALERSRWSARGPRRGVFLDRDGTLTPESGALGRPEALRLLPGVGEALRALTRGGYEAIVVTNQAAIGRGWITEEAVAAVHARLRRLLRAEGVELAAIDHCPHRPEDGCDCRKPEPGLLLRARDHLGVRLSDAWMIGDSTRDVQAARRAGVRAMLLESGWGGRDPGAPPAGIEPEARARDLREAARRIVEDGA